jgi:SAM-dependent methyltransferase
MSEHEHFRAAYAEGATPPWDIGRPQPALIEVGRRGWVRGAVLDAGCGTGEHALHFAAAGCDVVGVDVVPAAIERAIAKAAERRLFNPPRFIVADVLRDPEALAGRTFDTVVDMGFFHTLSDEQRSAWREVLAGILKPGGSYVMVCFSELVPGGFGPRRISEAEIRETFAEDAGFVVADLERASILSMRDDAPVEIPGWLARIEQRGRS